MKRKALIPLLICTCILGCTACSKSENLPSYSPTNDSTNISITTNNELLPDESIIITEPTTVAVNGDSKMNTVKGWFADQVSGEWTQAETGDQFYGETNITPSGVEITVLLYCGEYYATEFNMHSIDEEEIYTTAIPLLNAYLGRALTDTEQNSFRKGVDDVFYNPDEGVSLTDFDNANTIELYTDRETLYIKCY